MKKDYFYDVADVKQMLDEKDDLERISAWHESTASKVDDVKQTHVALN